jgi:hypothetical protein
MSTKIFLQTARRSLWRGFFRRQSLRDSDEPPLHPNRPRLQVEKQLRNMTMRTGWHIDYLDDAGELRIELVVVAPDQHELLLDAYETVGHNARANPGHLVESLADELPCNTSDAQRARKRCRDVYRRSEDRGDWGWPVEEPLDGWKVN